MGSIRTLADARLGDLADTLEASLLADSPLDAIASRSTLRAEELTRSVLAENAEAPGVGYDAAFMGAKESFTLGPQYFQDPTDGTAPNGKVILDWDEAAAQLTRLGTSWSAGLGQAVTVTYAYRATDPGAAIMPGDSGGFSQFNAAQIAFTEIALRLWADIANITFVRVGSGTEGPGAYSDSAAMLFANYATGLEGSTGWGYYPWPGSTGDLQVQGDVWISSAYAENTAPVYGGYGPHLFAHEIGHAIGLQHPGDYDSTSGQPITYANSAEYWQDSRAYTTMSYFGSGVVSHALGNFAAGPMLHDIAAAQRLYGANMTTRTGDTTYGFGSNTGLQFFTVTSTADRPIFAVWDAGGIDTFNFSIYTTDMELDLRAEAFSSVGAGSNGVGSAIGNISIARGVVIENAIGGSGWDTITGNAAANTLTGNAGNDVIEGLSGADTISGGDGNDELDGGDFGDTISGGDGNDFITGGLFNEQQQDLSPDMMNGGAGDDTLIGDILDTYIGGGGYDVAVVVHSASTTALVLDLSPINSGSNASLHGPAFISADFEEFDIHGGEGADTITGSNLIDTLRGYLGNDTLNGSGGDDTLYGDFGTDDLKGGEGADILDGGAGVDKLDGGGGDDVIICEADDNLASVLGGSGNDLLIFTGGVAPTSLNLVANGFESVEGRVYDTVGGNPWSERHDIYDLQWRLDRSSLYNDDSTREELDYDEASSFNWSTYFQRFDWLDRIAESVLIFDDNTRNSINYDSSGDEVWTQYYWREDAAGLRIESVLVYDDDARDSNNYDAADNFNWHEFFWKEDNLGRRQEAVLVYDDGGRDSNNYDAVDAFDWTEFFWKEDALERRIESVLIYDDSSRDSRNYDHVDAFAWEDFWWREDTLGRRTEDILTYDDGSRDTKDYDETNSFTWANIFRHYDPGGVLTQTITTYDDGSIVIG